MDYTGPTECLDGLVCYILTDYFYQCINPSNKDCNRFPSKTTQPEKDWRLLDAVSPVKNKQTCNALLVFNNNNKKNIIKIK